LEHDFVTVDMPSENDVGPRLSSAATTAQDEQQRQQQPEQQYDGNTVGVVVGEESSESRNRHKRSLLKTLWSEATSTTDLPAPGAANQHRMLLHHRRTTNTNTNSSSSKDRAYNNGNGPRRGSREGSKFRQHPQRYNRVGRGAKIARQVWMAAFAAFAASVLIVLHVFLYRVFTGGDVGNDNGIDTSKDAFLAATKHGMPIMGAEDGRTTTTLDEARSHELSSIRERSIDTSQYTIRMNTWRRDEQLLLSVDHHARCDGVALIQIVWCDSRRDPPDGIAHHPSGKVRVERHGINSLNERFKVLEDPPTLGILSLDDDVMRPCMALDAAFVRWTRHPERMVGFDVRSHVVVDEGDDGDDNEEGAMEGGSSNNNNAKSTRWKYGYMSTTESSNSYSLTLPRASFLHRDYLDMYVMALPRKIYSYVAEHLECEDIAMSFLVSSLTDGRPPLVADYWAVKSMVKLYSQTKISGGAGHKSTRDDCVDDFADILGLKEDGERPLRAATLVHRGEDIFFGYGAETEDWSDVDPEAVTSSRLRDVVEVMRKLKSYSGDERMRWLARMKGETMIDARKAGMIEKTEEWRERWGKK